MESIVIFIPKEYLVLAMSPHKQKVLELANAILENLRTPPNYQYWADGSKLHRYTTETTVHLLVLQVHLMADTPIFKDALTQLEEDKYISVSGDIITLLPKGRLFIMDSGYDYGQNNPAPKLEFMLKDEILVPIPNTPKDQTPKKIEAPISFTRKLSIAQRNTLIAFLKEHKLVNKPSKFIAFLNGENDGSGIEIYEDEEHKLAAVTILLSKLYEDGKIKLNATKAYQHHFTSHISPFSKYDKKEQAEQFKKEVRKRTNRKWLECPIAKSLEETISALIAAGITVFVIYPQ